jgi:hypothetical protein
VRATRCNVPGVSSRVTKTGRPKEGLPERDIARAQRALLEAAHRVGSDGNGRDGIVGYFTWVAERDPTFFYVDLWSRLLELQIHEEAMSAAAPGTTNEPGDRKKQPMTFELREGPDNEVQDSDEPGQAVLQSALRCLADAAKGLESAGATERALGRWPQIPRTLSLADS